MSQLIKFFACFAFRRFAKKLHPTRTQPCYVIVTCRRRGRNSGRKTDVPMVHLQSYRPLPPLRTEVKPRQKAICCLINLLACHIEKYVRTWWGTAIVAISPVLDNRQVRGDRGDAKGLVFHADDPLIQKNESSVCTAYSYKYCTE
jgi:hypothetical protein